MGDARVVVVTYRSEPGRSRSTARRDAEADLRARYPGAEITFAGQRQRGRAVETDFAIKRAP